MSTKRKRLARERVSLGDFAFDCTRPFSSKGTMRVVALDTNSEQWAVHFEPPLAKRDAGETTVSVTHLPSRGCHCRLRVVPDTRRVERALIGTRIRLLCFETHAVQLDPGDATRVATVWLTLINVQLKGPELAPMWQPVVDYSWWFRAHFPDRFESLPYFPPDPSIDVSELGALGVDPSRVPQRGPLWFKLRGEVTGSAIPRAVGEFAPALGSKGAADYAPYRRQSFTGWRLISVTFGKLREDVQVACILAHYPQRTFIEAGYCTYAAHPAWGASPDGFIVDADMTWEKIPASTRESYPSLDPRRGVVEFKASRWDCEIKAYHLGQVVWEMMCSDTPWCDIVRYSERWERDERNVFRTLHECKTIRVYRHAETEQRLCGLIRQSTTPEMKTPSGAQALLRLVWTEPFVSMRAHFAKLAAFCNADCKPVPVPLELVREMHALRDELALGGGNPQQGGGTSLHPAMDRIEERQSKAFALYAGTEAERGQFVRVATEQIEDYSCLIKSVLEPEARTDGGGDSKSNAW